MTIAKEGRGLATALWLVALGCGGLGHVNQGRVVEYNRAGGTVTFIQDSAYLDPAHPRFDVLPPVTVRIPVNPKEMGPAPAAGRLLSLDAAGKQAVVFEPSTGEFRAIPVALVSRSEGVYSDDARVAGKSFPIIDREKKTVTVFFRGQRQLASFAVADEQLALPPEAWAVGDDIRYYYKDPGQALRLMNITKTDIHKAAR